MGGSRGKLVLERKIMCKPRNLCKSQVTQAEQRCLGLETDCHLSGSGLSGACCIPGTGRRVNYSPGSFAGSLVALAWLLELGLLVGGWMAVAECGWIAKAQDGQDCHYQY